LYAQGEGKKKGIITVKGSEEEPGEETLSGRKEVVMALIYLLALEGDNPKTG